MELPELHTNNPWVVVGLGALSLATTVGSFLAHAIVKKFVQNSEENEKLKKDAIEKKIEDVRRDVMAEIGKLEAKFSTLQAAVIAAVRGAETEALRQGNRLASAMTAIKNINAKSEIRFGEFQRSLKEVHVYVEKIRKGG